MRITLNKVLSLTVDHWGPTLDHARSVRPQIWTEVLAHREVIHQAPPDAVDTLRELFVFCRIEINRALRALENNGDVNTILVDPIPEFEQENDLHFIRDEAENERLVFAALENLHGIDTVHDFDHKAMALYEQEKSRLQAENKLLPGIMGI